MAADYSERWKTGQPALGVQLLDLHRCTNLPLADLHRYANLNALADLQTLRLPDLQSPPPGPNALAVVNALVNLRGSASSRAAAEALAGVTGILSRDPPPADLDAVPKRAEMEIASVAVDRRPIWNLIPPDIDPPCPAMQGAAGPPDWRACFLLDLFLGKADREIMRGDLEEEFATSILPRYGARRAQFWFWWQTMRTIRPGTPSVGGGS